MSATTSAAAPATRPLLLALRVTAALAVLTVLAQFVTAGQLFGDDGPVLAHQAGAIVLHVMSGLAAIVAIVLWRRGAAPVGLAALAVVVFGIGFVQAALGGYQTLYAHVPGAMLLTAGAVWLLVVALRRPA